MGQSVVGGEPVSSATTHSSAGQQADEETGLHYNRHRYYDPLQGRYITQNPIGLEWVRVSAKSGAGNGSARVICTSVALARSGSR